MEKMRYKHKEYLYFHNPHDTDFKIKVAYDVIPFLYFIIIYYY